jgi:hypothetical protein
MNEKCNFGNSGCKLPQQPNCDDGKMCTTELAICKSGVWRCTNTKVTCPGGFSCDPLSGNCKNDDKLIPCVAVIDEDSSFGTPNQAAQWTEVRTQYPSRPFCLLVPNPIGKVGIPSNFLADDLTIVEYNIVRDFGDQAIAEDWAVKCGLNFYASNQVGYVGLFVDDSGSLEKSEVIASYDKFIAFMATQTIEIKKVVNTEENWILSFLTTLVPPLTCVAKGGRRSKCIDSGICTADGKTPVLWQQGDPQPNCFNFPSNSQCCVDEKDCITNDEKEGKCIDSGVCTTDGKTPVLWQQGDPQPYCFNFSSNIQCCEESIFKL